MSHRSMSNAADGTFFFYCLAITILITQISKNCEVIGHCYPMTLPNKIYILGNIRKWMIRVVCKRMVSTQKNLFKIHMERFYQF